MTAASPEPTDGPWAAPAASGANPASGDGTWAPPPNPPTASANPPADAPDPREAWAGTDQPLFDGTFTAAGTDPAFAYGSLGPAAPRVPAKQRLGAAGLTAVVVAVIGAPLGLLWSVVAPGVPIIKTDDGAVFATPSPEQFIASDGWFTILLFALGVVAALVTWVFFKRFRGPWTLAGLIVGTVGASILAWQVGRRIGVGAFHDAVAAAQSGDLIIRPPDLRAGGFTKLWDVIPFVHGDLLMATFGAVIIYTLLAGWSRTPSLRAEPPLPQPAAVNPFYTLGEVQGPQAPPQSGELADPGR